MKNRTGGASCDELTIYVCGREKNLQKVLKKEGMGLYECGIVNPECGMKRPKSIGHSGMGWKQVQVSGFRVKAKCIGHGAV